MDVLFDPNITEIFYRVVRFSKFIPMVILATTASGRNSKRDWRSFPYGLIEQQWRVSCFARVLIYLDLEDKIHDTLYE